MQGIAISTLRNRLFILAGALLLSLPLHGQTAALTRDINTRSDNPVSSFPSQMLALGGKIFFVAADEGTGRELWVSDGSAAGTQMLGDLCPGYCDASPVLLGGAGGVLLFTVRVDEDDSRRELWRSDGMRAGTFRLLGPGAASIPPTAVISLGGALLFGGCTPDRTCSLWRSDGTAQGTQIVKDVVVSSLVAAGGKAYFHSGEIEDSLWVTDGTAAGTRVIYEFPDFAFLRSLTAAGNRLFFFATVEGSELWTSDGTAAGTRALTSFVPDAPFVRMEELKVAGDHVYFPANDVIHGLEIWRSDGTPETTRRITEFGFHEPIDRDSILSQMEELGGRLFFAATDGLSDVQLWTTSGTPQSTAPLACAGGCPRFAADRLLKVGSRILFGAVDDAHGRELWSTDGTLTGTVRTSDVCPGDCDGLADDPVPLLGSGFFVGEPSDFSPALQLWTSDGTTAGTRTFADPASGVRLLKDFEIEAAALGPTLYFTAGGSYGAELWASDGSLGGTRLVTDLAHDAPGSEPLELTALGERVIFTACGDLGREVWQSSGPAEATSSLASGHFSCSGSGSPHQLTAAPPWVYYWIEQGASSSLWRTDGTAAGAVQLLAINFSSASDSDLAFFGDRVFFALPGADDGTVFWGMWRSNGTVTGTQKIFNVPAAAGRPRFLTALGSRMYFMGDGPSFTSELWTSDGTAAGTRQLTTASFDFRGSPQFTLVGNTVFFTARNQSHFDLELWKTDGTSANMVPVTGDSSEFEPVELTAFHGALYFLSPGLVAGVHGRALWRSDGTAAGTVPIIAFAGEDPSNPISDAFGLTVLGDRLYFAVDDGVHGRELWTSDGTAAGTFLVRDVRPGRSGSHPTGLTAAGGRLYFSAVDADHGFELWQSDGTAAGTRMVQDLAPWGASSYPEQITVAEGRLYFTADDRLHGREVWTLPLAGSGCQPAATSLCLNGGRFKVEADWRDFQGNTGRGQAVALTADTGTFWFFDPANVEVILKVLDGRGLNDHFWVFFGALSNVEYSLTVTDTASGATRRYFNPSGTFGSVGDTRGFGPLGAYSITQRTTPAAVLPLVEEHIDFAAATGVCQPGTARLCLNNGRFAIEASWKDFTNRIGSGTAVPLTSDTGYFWFFDAANVEVVIKVLDGQALNGRFWVFYGALSNVEYSLTVTDTATGRVRTYGNPSGRFASLGDTQAF